MRKQFIAKTNRFAQKHGLTVHWQALKFGYHRAVLICSDAGTYLRAKTQALRLRDVSCTFRCRSWNGGFEGILNIMDSCDADALDKLLEAEQTQTEDWWQRYHDADEETRKAMACGKIN